jgi:hypothetical protein
MAEQRCPMCSTLNPAEAETCVSCGARLKPLLAGDAHPEAEEPRREDFSAEDQGDTGEVDDWLARIRAGVSEPEEEPEPEEPAEPGYSESATGSPDWLGGLRDAEDRYNLGGPEEAIPEWMDEFIAAGDEEKPQAVEEEDAGDVPEWLARVRARKAFQPEEEAPAAGDAGEDWLDKLRSAQEEEPAEFSAAESEPFDSGLEGLLPGEDEEPEEEPPAEERELPDLKPGQGRDIYPTPPSIDLGKLSDVPGVPGSPHVLGARAEEEAEEGQRRVAASGFGIDWGEGEGRPVDQEQAGGEDGEPHVPALVSDESGERPIIEIDERALDSIELPAWLDNLRLQPMEETPEEGEPAEPKDEAEEADLAPATLPSWLEAMRPVDTFRPEIEIVPEDVQAVESVGPLAGLRGVLMAEPVVAIPRTSSAAAARLEVSERQYAQGELLHRLIEEEQRESMIARRPGRPLPIARWIISFLILLAVMLPPSFSRLGLQGFSHPVDIPRELVPLQSLVNSVPADRPALIIFDYTPSYSGELDNVAGALIQHAFARAIPLVTLSTRPTGPPLAERLLSELGAPYAAVNGQAYVHLGYLAGGPTAVQLFAISPRDAVLTGFLVPETGEASTLGLGPQARSAIWSHPLLAGITRLSDFGMVVVITSGTETARNWAEQTHPWIGDRPLIMVLSAGAEPLVRPYYESSEPLVNGILTGLPAALAYEDLNGQQSTTGDIWNTFGSGMLFVELILLAGALYGAGAWLVSLRRRRTE